MTESIESLKATISEYERRMGIGEHDPSKDGYLVLVAILRQQNLFLGKFKIEDEIAKTTKEDASYGRAKDMWENLPKMIENVNNLKIALKMDGEEKKDTRKPFSAKDVANGVAM